MNNGTISQKPSTRTYFVSGVGSAFPAAAVFQPINTAYYNETNATVTVNTVVYQPSQIMLSIGQVQVYNQNDQAITSATTVASVSSFWFAQKRDTSLDTSSLPSRPAETSEKIPVNATIEISAKVCAIDINNTWVIGARTALAAKLINTNENTIYGLTLAHKGQWANRMNARNNAATFPQFEVADTWANLGIAAVVDRRDYIVQNLVYNVNRESRLWNQLESQPVIALALDNTIAAGGLPTLGSLVVGQVVTIAYKNGNTAEPIQFTVTNGIYQAIQAAIATTHVVAGAVIVPANPSTAGGTSRNCDQIFLIDLDRGIVETDRARNIKYRVQPGLSEGFNSFVLLEETSKPFEGYGLSRHVRLDYEEYAELNKAWRVQNPSGNAFQYPQDIVNTRAYTIINIEWSLLQEGSNSYLGIQPQLITIAIPCCDSATVTAWQTLLNGFFKNLPNCRFIGSHINSTTGNFEFAGVTAPCGVAFDNPFKTA